MMQYSIRRFLLVVFALLAFSMIVEAHETVGTKVGVAVGQSITTEADLIEIEDLSSHSSLTSSCIPNATLVEKTTHILIDLQNKGWQPKIIELCRTREQQREKINDGYSQTMRSLHLKGRAVDIADMRYLWTIPQSHKFWKDLGKACRKQGLIWGGDWKGFTDVAHCEMPPGME